MRVAVASQTTLPSVAAETESDFVAKVVLVDCTESFTCDEFAELLGEDPQPETLNTMSKIDTESPFETCLRASFSFSV